MIKVFDFFCGCGGTSAGFRRAGLDIPVGVDRDPDGSIWPRFSLDANEARYDGLASENP
jgi:C-5 cytosine-specific DNA methylase